METFKLGFKTWVQRAFVEEFLSARNLRNWALLLVFIFVSQSFAKIITPIDKLPKENSFSSRDFNQLIEDNQAEQRAIVEKFQKNAVMDEEQPRTAKMILDPIDPRSREQVVSETNKDFFKSKRDRNSRKKMKSLDQKIAEELKEAL